ncbi:hypothetical protein CW711_05265 [Candidatus Bathyarchaeota archaeon]|nr:MAG: hypothetical protein B6U84_03090 [Candidatus Bathyarchaeota archaeon ex4484_40]RJS78438.1 MAG: hypothetical protein CW711_05265 [Candidatus Bathyarchaeota archaeon]
MRNATEGKANLKRDLVVGKTLPEIAVNLSAALLIWLFGVLVFIPIALGIDPAGLLLPCSLIILLGFSFFLFKASRGLRDVLDAASEVLAYKWVRRRRRSRLEEVERKVRAALYSATIVIFYLLYSPLLAGIHPSINGVTAILIILGVLSILFRGLAGE